MPTRLADLLASVLRREVDAPAAAGAATVPLHVLVTILDAVTIEVTVPSRKVLPPCAT